MLKTGPPGPEAGRADGVSLECRLGREKPGSPQPPAPPTPSDYCSGHFTGGECVPSLFHDGFRLVPDGVAAEPATLYGEALHAYPSLSCWTLDCRPGCLSESSAPCPSWGCPHPRASWSPEHRVGRGPGLGCRVALPSPQLCRMPPGTCGLLQVPHEKGQARGRGRPGAVQA